MTAATTAPRMRSRRRTAAVIPQAATKPMLAVLSDLPADQRRYAFEFKWDGIRALTIWDGRELRILSRNGLDNTLVYPELAALAEALGERSAVLDGEICVLDENDRPNFGLLQQRMKADRATALHRAKSLPVQYFLFDILYLDGKLTIDLPWTRRRALLEEVTVKGPYWELSPARIGEGQAMLETARAHQLEGIVAKRIDSVYEPGRRSPNWLKIKLVQRQEFVVGGYTNEKGTGIRGGLGSLQVGYYDCSDAPKLHYAGGVGSGFTAETHARLLKMLREREIARSPFLERIPGKKVNFVRPELVVEVEYRRWPQGGMLQQAAFKGVRTDKPAREVVREDRACR
ncbi:MAG TPA: non-homologous end-joining DNA ligase [Tepidisphaeraceae bacterium]|nr:non-homologous end-joining DNA ligase [Tepidisphaeraceae bacterium]